MYSSCTSNLALPTMTNEHRAITPVTFTAGLEGGILSIFDQPSPTVRLLFCCSSPLVLVGTQEWQDQPVPTVRRNQNSNLTVGDGWSKILNIPPSNPAGKVTGVMALCSLVMVGRAKLLVHELYEYGLELYIVYRRTMQPNCPCVNPKINVKT